jgi:hypothetical protein
MSYELCNSDLNRNTVMIFNTIEGTKKGFYGLRITVSGKLYAVMVL